MGGFGLISNMISSIKLNRNQLPKGKTLSEQAKLYKATDKGKPLHFPNNMSSEERELFLENLKDQKHKSFTQLIYVIVFIIVVVGIVLFLVNI